MSSYHQSYWRTRAAVVIAGVIAKLPEQSDETTIRMALSLAYPFGEKKYNKYRVWLDEINVQLGKKPPADQRGRKKPPVPDPDPNQLSLFGEGEA